MQEDKDALIVPGWIMRNRNLDAVARIILAAVEEAGDKGCFTTNAELADMVNISRRTVTRAIGDLVNDGYIRSEPINAWTRRLTIMRRDE